GRLGSRRRSRARSAGLLVPRFHTTTHDGQRDDGEDPAPMLPAPHSSASGSRYPSSSFRVASGLRGASPVRACHAEAVSLAELTQSRGVSFSHGDAESAESLPGRAAFLVSPSVPRPDPRS